VEDRASNLTRIAVVGAGWAGAAAAVTLARLGRSVTLYEAAPIAGGRARRVERGGLPLDNGQHLLLGAYVQTRNLLAAVHGGDGEHGLARSPLALVGFGTHARSLDLRARAWPGALGLAAGVLAARGLSIGERIGLLTWFERLRRAGFRCDARATVPELLADGPRAAARALWEPLCLAALNTPPERASAQVFANVLRAAFTGPPGASDFLFATSDLSAVFPERAAHFVAKRGGRVELAMRARVELAGDSVGIVTRGRREPFDAAIVAVGPHQLDEALAPHPAFDGALAAARRLAYEPIATAWLGYAARTPMPSVARLDDAPGQWIVDRPDVLARAAPAARASIAQLVGVVISAGGPHEAMAGRELALACDAQLRRLAPGWPPLAWSQTIVERRATYACTPGRARAPSALPHPRVALAGDWLDTEFPATLEAAVRTGVAAAFAITQPE
jgi:squalene-associated FAD-dependent desaturase